MEGVYTSKVEFGPLSGKHGNCNEGVVKIPKINENMKAEGINLDAAQS